MTAPTSRHFVTSEVRCITCAGCCPATTSTGGTAKSRGARCSYAPTQCGWRTPEVPEGSPWGTPGRRNDVNPSRHGRQPETQNPGLTGGFLRRRRNLNPRSPYEDSTLQGRFAWPPVWRVHVPLWRKSPISYGFGSKGMPRPQSRHALVTPQNQRESASSGCSGSLGGHLGPDSVPSHSPGPLEAI